MNKLITLFHPSLVSLITGCAPLLSVMQAARFAFLTVLLLASISLSIPAQELKKNAYRVRVQLLDGRTFDGYLYEFNDSSVRVMQYERKNMDTLFSFRRISNMALRIKNAPGNGLGAGVGVGAGLGALVGYAFHSTPDCSGGFCIDYGPGLSALVGGFVGGLGGGVLGIIVGSKYTSFTINGDFVLFSALKEKLLKGPRRTIRNASSKSSVVSRATE